MRLEKWSKNQYQTAFNPNAKDLPINNTEQFVDIAQHAANLVLLDYYFWLLAKWQSGGLARAENLPWLSLLVVTNVTGEILRMPHFILLLLATFPLDFMDKKHGKSSC